MVTETLTSAGSSSSQTMMEPRRSRPIIKDVLEDLIDEMVSKGILWHEALAQFEKLFILRVLRESDGSVVRASEKMGVHRNTLSKKMREHGIDKKMLR